MKAARPGRWEYEVEAAIEYWYMKNGAMSWGYPSIVGSGPNATTLHYGESTRQMQDGDLLLVDAAANFQGLTVTSRARIPVNGKFTPEQREIYELVLQAQEAGIAAAKPGAPTAGDQRRPCRAVFADGTAQKLGLITDTPAAQVSTWFTHGRCTASASTSTIRTRQTLVPGAAFVIEPGLYFPEYNLDSLVRRGRGGAPLPSPQDPGAIMALVKPVVREVQEHRRPHRGLVPDDRAGTGQPVREGAASDRRHREGRRHGQVRRGSGLRAPGFAQARGSRQSFTPGAPSPEPQARRGASPQNPHTRPRNGPRILVVGKEVKGLLMRVDATWKTGWW